MSGVNISEKEKISILRELETINQSINIAFEKKSWSYILSQKNKISDLQKKIRDLK